VPDSLARAQTLEKAQTYLKFQVTRWI